MYTHISNSIFKFKTSVSISSKVKIQKSQHNHFCAQMKLFPTFNFTEIKADPINIRIITIHNSPMKAPIYCNLKKNCFCLLSPALAKRLKNNCFWKIYMNLGEEKLQPEFRPNEWERIVCQQGNKIFSFFIFFPCFPCWLYYSKYSIQWKYKS